MYPQVFPQQEFVPRYDRSVLKYYYFKDYHHVDPTVGYDTLETAVRDRGTGLSIQLLGATNFPYRKKKNK